MDFNQTKFETMKIVMKSNEKQKTLDQRNNFINRLMRMSKNIRRVFILTGQARPGHHKRTT